MFDAEADRARLAAILESSDDAILSKSIEGEIRAWNAGATRLFGYTDEEAIGKPITLVVPPDRLEEEMAMLAELARGHRIAPRETVRVAKDGRRVDVSITISPIRDRDGKIIAASTIARDITERKRHELELRKWAQSIADADRHKDNFIALLSHELRNPLAPLRAALSVLQLSTENIGGEAQHAMAVMERQLKHMVRLIDDLLDISRIGRNKLHLQRARVSLSEVVSHALEAAGPAIDSSRHRVEISVVSHDDLARVIARFPLRS